MLKRRLRGSLLRPMIYFGAWAALAGTAVEAQAQNFPQAALAQSQPAGAPAVQPPPPPGPQRDSAPPAVGADEFQPVPEQYYFAGDAPADLQGGLQFFPHAYRPLTQEEYGRFQSNAARAATMGPARPKAAGSRYPDKVNQRNIGEADRDSPASAGAPSEQPLLRMTDITLAGRGVPYYDTTRMNPAATGYFLTSAIPVKTDPFFGASGRAGVQANGSSVALTLASSPIVGAQPLSATVKMDTIADSMSSGSANVNFTRVFGQWDIFTFGIADTAFADPASLCNTITTLGPVGRTSVLNGVPQVCMTFLRPENPKTDPTGFYSLISLEAVAPDIALPAAVTATPAATHDLFSRYPDLVWTLSYQDYSMRQDGCVLKPDGSPADPTKEENWHLQFGTVLRDLSFEEAAGPPSAHTCGWGLQLSGAFQFTTDSCRDLRDAFYFSVTGGKGISHYFNDLHLVSATNDAVYGSTSNELFLVPLVAGYVGYTHEWDQSQLADGASPPTTYVVSSTVAFSYIGLANPDGSPLLTYRQGEELSVNLIYHFYQCSAPKPTLQYVSDVTQDSSGKVAQKKGKYYATPPAWKDMFLGVEAAYGQRENFAGSWGDDGRIMLVIAATK